MKEPTIWLQLGISDERYRVISTEISSILKTGETSGNMMLMLKSNTKMSIDEKYYAAYMIAREDMMRKLTNAMPAGFAGVVKKVMER
jgi:hypothetical protein